MTNVLVLYSGGKRLLLLRRRTALDAIVNEGLENHIQQQPELGSTYNFETQESQQGQILLKRNVVHAVNMHIVLSPYKSPVLLVVLSGLSCVHVTRADLRKLERFQKRELSWITGKHETQYTNALKNLNVLPLPMYIQTNDLLFLSKLIH